MKTTELLLAELDREASRSRRTLENMPEGKHDWKPHDKSMAFGYLAELVASMPSWVEMEITRDELDLNPAGGSQTKREPLNTRADYVRKLDETVAAARTALQKTSDDHLRTPWRLLVAGNVVLEMSRYDMIRDTLNHLAHHRGQMTVYLRLLGAKVPALYGPSADDRSFS
jgi:uncharacterized damage-inducible protein DinB